MRMRTLVLGFGNLDRQDDGVAYEVVNGVRRHIGLEPLGEAATGLEETDQGVGAVFVPQLGPELVDAAVDYDQVIFVDAHVQPHFDNLYWAEVHPEFRSSAFGHHLTPQTFLGWLQALHQHQLAGSVVSIRGHSFGFERGLSEATAAQVAPAVKRVLHLLAEGPNSKIGPNRKGGSYNV